jgi:hypothetical protein
MNQNPSAASPVLFSRHVSRVKLVDSRKLARRLQGTSSLPSGPILFIPVESPLSGIAGRMGVTAINGCDMLFFDVQTDAKYFCNVASAGDPEVVAALLRWNESGLMPVWLETPQGQCGFMRLPFQLNDTYRQAFVNAARKDYLSDLQTQFNRMLEPGAVESVVAARTGQVTVSVQVGFLATVHTQPKLDQLH